MAKGDKYVMDGAYLTCDKGVIPTRFMVTPKPVLLYDAQIANEADRVPLLNIQSFGLCQATQKPCVPLMPTWDRVADFGITAVGGRPLLDTSKCMCGAGGKIAVHLNLAAANAAVALDQKLDQIDKAADIADEASTWAFVGALALGIGGAIMVATGVGAPLGAAMMVGAGHLMTASAVLGTAAAVAKGATKFARDPSKEVGLAIVGEVAWEAAKNYVMKRVGGIVLKKLGQWAQRSMNKLGLSKAACRRANKLLCTFTGHPVDVLKGYLYTETVDFELPGPVPLRWERQWYSNSIHQGPLGHGWHHSYDMAIHLDAEQNLMAFRTADGRGVAFDWVPLGQRSFNRLEKLSLLHDARGYAVLDHQAGLTYRFGVNRGDGVSALTAVEDANGFAIALHYDGRGSLCGITDSARRELAVECDDAGRILHISTAHPTEPRQRVTLVSYEYDKRSGMLLGSTDALGYADRYKYKQQLLVQETFKDGLSFYFEFDKPGPEARCTRTWGDGGIYDHQLHYLPGEAYAYQTTVRNSLGQATTFFGNENGLVVKTMDARGGITLTDYNEANELVSETDALGYETEYAYDERGNCLSTELPGGHTVRRTYDAQNRLTALTDLVGGQWQWQYDAAGNLLARTDPRGQTEQYSYADGLLRTLTDAAGRVTHVRYDAACNVVEVQGPGGTSRRLPDGWGRPRKLTDERGNVQWREYDLLDRVTILHEPDGNVRRFSYDAVGNVVRAQDRHHDVQYAYRGMNRLIRRVEAGTAIELLHDTEEQLRAIVNEHGLAYRFELDGAGDVVTEVGFDGLTRRYQRDAGGRVLELMLPDGQRTRYAYDAAGRVTEVVYGDGTTETYDYRADGALLAARNEAATVTFIRDIVGAVLQEQQNGHTVRSVLDAAGLRVGLHSSLGADVSFRHGALGAVEEIQAGGGWQASFTRDAQGLELHRSYSSGLRTRWRRDALGRPTEQHIGSGGLGGGAGRERVRTYDWQINDRLAGIDDSLHGRTRYQHDAVGNLAATLRADGGAELRQPDAVGNLFRSAARTDRRYGPAGQLLEAGGTRYHYDAAGQLAGKTLPTGAQWHYRWHAAGHLAEVVRPDGGVVRFTYDALGRRVSKHYRGRVTRWVWDGDTPLHEWQELEVGPEAGSITDLTTWLFEADSFAPLAKLTAQGSYSVVCDQLGTPLELYDAQGAKTWQAELDSYGLVRQGQGQPQDCPFRYQGQYEDTETGLYYNRFRYYDPENGVYTSQDPIKLAGGIELYAYVNDSSRFVDVYGLSAGHTFPSWMSSRQGYQRHHIIPHSLRNHSIMQRAGMNINSATNMTYLPVANGIDSNPNRSLHRGYNAVHADYNTTMRQQLDELDALSRRENWKPERMRQEVLQLQHDTRKGLNTGTVRCH